jgi:hypothetical protein
MEKDDQAAPLTRQPRKNRVKQELVWLGCPGRTNKAYNIENDKIKAHRGTSRDDGINLQPHGGLRALTRLAGRSRDETAEMLFPGFGSRHLILEGNMNAAISVYLEATFLEAPLLSFTRTWYVKVTT